MKHKYCAIPVLKTTDSIPAGNNKKEAIKLCKEIALWKKTSVMLFQYVGQDKVFIGIAEFPYYLRNCNLDTSDITWNGRN